MNTAIESKLEFWMDPRKGIFPGSDAEAVVGSVVNQQQRGLGKENWQMECVITSINDGSQIKVQDILIDRKLVENYGLKTTQDGARKYWRIKGDLVSHGAKDGGLVRFRVNLSSITGSDLDACLDRFILELTANKVLFEVKTGGKWNDGQKTIEYQGWVELKLPVHRTKVSLFK